MTPVIHSGAIYQNATPAKLYELFVNSAKHTAATGMPAKISPKAGGKWSAFGGMILGKNLVLIPNRMIVQTSTSGVGSCRRSGIRPRGRHKGLGEVLLGPMESISSRPQAVG
jgi:hypothetical protein